MYSAENADRCRVTFYEELCTSFLSNYEELIIDFLQLDTLVSSLIILFNFFLLYFRILLLKIFGWFVD